MEQQEFYYEGKNFTFRKNFKESFGFMVLKGPQIEDDALEFQSNVINVLKKSPELYEALKTSDTLLDCSGAVKIDHEARRIYTELAKEFPNSYLAVFGTNSLIRIILGFILTAAGRKNIKFFETKEQALNWLKK